MALPYFKFYPNDWLGSQNIELMTAEEEGAYIHLLARAWNSEDCSLPGDDETLSRLSRLDGRWLVASAKIRERFVLKDGRLFPKKLHGLFKDACEVSDSKKEGSAERWGREKYFESEKVSFEELLKNVEWIGKQQTYHPGLNIQLSLEKAREFWGSEAGWEYSKRKKSKLKNWKLTYANALSQKCNQVWIPRDNSHPKDFDRMPPARSGLTEATAKRKLEILGHV